MRTGVACWTAGISCLYFSFLHLFRFCTGMDMVFILTILFVWLAVYVSGKLPKVGKILGFLLLSIPVIVAYWMLLGTESFIISILPPILYAFYTIVTEKWEAVYWEKRQLFAASAVVLGIELFASLVMEKEMTVILAYALAYLLLVFMALNIFRFGRAIDKKGKSFYAIHLGLYIFACGACAGIINFIGRKGGKILELILTPFAMLFAAFVSLGSGVTSMLGNQAEELEEATEKIEEQVMQNQQTAIDQTISNDASGETLGWLIKVALVMALILFLAYILYRLYRFYQGRCARVEEVSEMTGTIETIGRKGFGKINLFKTNREKIRKEYVKHMRTVRVKGYHISKASTSLDICNEAKVRLDYGELTEERIRELYMKARYSEEEITDEEVKEMRQLV